MYVSNSICLSVYTHTHIQKLSNIQYSIVNCGFPALLVVQMVKNLLKMLEMWVQFISWEDPVGQGMATYSSILAGEFLGWGALWATVHGVGKSQTRLSN